MGRIHCIENRLAQEPKPSLADNLMIVRPVDEQGNTVKLNPNDASLVQDVALALDGIPVVVPPGSPRN